MWGSFPKETTEIVWPHFKEGRGGYHREDAEDTGAGKWERKAKKPMVR